MYCIVFENGKEVNTGKRVNISIEFQEYKNVLFNTPNETNSKQST